jgi:hypothetical protein
MGGLIDATGGSAAGLAVRSSDGVEVDRDPIGGSEGASVGND